MRLLSSFLCALTLMALAGPAAAEEIKTGMQYTGPRELGIEQIGVSFKLPAGWQGVLPQGEQTFIIAQPGMNGYIFIVAEETTVAQAKTDMSKAMPMDQLVMTPKGEAKVKGTTVTNSYTVTGGQTPLEGDATAKIGKAGWGVMVLAVGTPQDMPAFKKVASQIAASVKIVAPKKPKIAKGSTKGHWGKMFAGKRIVRFFHGSNYGEKTQIFMCPDGRFAYQFEGGGFSMDGASGAFQSKNGGTWSTSGDASRGVLKLTYNDGRVSTYELREDGGKLMLDGNRWLREAINCP